MSGRAARPSFCKPGAVKARVPSSSRLYTQRITRGGSLLQAHQSREVTNIVIEYDLKPIEIGLLRQRAQKTWKIALHSEARHKRADERLLHRTHNLARRCMTFKNRRVGLRFIPATQIPPARKRSLFIQVRRATPVVV